MSGVATTRISLPSPANEGDLYGAANGHVYHYRGGTWLDVSGLFSSTMVRAQEPPADGRGYMRVRQPGSMRGQWVLPEPLDLTPYRLKDAPPVPTDVVGKTEVMRILAPIRAELIRLRDFLKGTAR